MVLMFEPGTLTPLVDLRDRDRVLPGSDSRPRALSPRIIGR
jgi:hypothetical protein